MVDETSVGQRPAGAVAACLGTRSRRLMIAGGFALLGWLGLSLAGAVHAAADAPNGSGKAATATHEVPASRSATAARRSKPARPAPAAPAAPAQTHASTPQAARPVTGVPAPIVRAAATRSGRTTITPSSDATASDATTVDPGDASAGDEPAATGAADSAAPGVLPLLGNAIPSGTAASPQTAVSPTRSATSAEQPPTSSVTGLLAPVTSLVSTSLSSTVAELAQPVSALTSTVDHVVSQPVGQLLNVVGAATSGVTRALPAILAAPAQRPAATSTPTPQEGVSRPARSTGAVPPVAVPVSSAPSATHHARMTGRSTSHAAHPAPRSVPSTAATLPHRVMFDGYGLPAPAPAVPPTGPDSALAGTAGATVAGGPGTGSSVSSACTGETWSAQQFGLLGRAEWDRSPSVRNSATKPPVSPD